ncbi:hypothetical protein F2Q68_00007086 [Brassica cretica]|uniref:NYN domain-containing protein n=1 Tax=Brassica cretica TaxID=69181 RepID=A0A8S9KR75_BRACR|nr:hypothetical protein F2Q68_00007086 [Brassica cretica]
MDEEGETILFYSVNETFVCWNIDDCPVPVDTDLGSIVDNFEHALHQMGFEGRMSINVDCKKLNSNEEALFKAGRIFYLPYALLKKGTNDNITIWAYVDERSWRDKCLGNKTWDSRIYFLPAGDRRVRMLNDMFLQSRDAPLHHCLGLLILVSNHFSGDPFYMELFEDMEHQNYHPFLIIPREHSNISESPDEWPQSLFNRPRKSSQGPLPKKPKLDAA